MMVGGLALDKKQCPAPSSHELKKEKVLPIWLQGFMASNRLNVRIEGEL